MSYNVTQRKTTTEQTENTVQSIIVPSRLLASEAWTFEAMHDAMQRRLPSGRRSRDYQTLPTFEIPDDWNGNLLAIPVDKKCLAFENVRGDIDVIEIDGAYDLTANKWYDLNEDAVRAWRRFAFPREFFDTRRKNTVVRSSTIWGRQNADGSGEIDTGRGLLAIRTRSKLMIQNSEHGDDWSYKRALDADATLPLDSVRGMLNGRYESLGDITRIHHGTKQELRIAELKNGEGIAVAFDPTMKTGRDHPNSGSSSRRVPTGWFGFRLSAQEMQALLVTDDALDLLMPSDIRELLDAGTHQLIEKPPTEWDVTGKTWGRRRVEKIVRQGEWFFIPMDPEFEPEAPIAKPFNGMIESRSVKHLPGFDRDIRVTTFPRMAFDGGVTPRQMDGNLFLEDTETGVWYTDREYLPFGASRKLMGNHVARDCAFIGEVDSPTELFVRGTVRHAEGDHPVYNFRERWFRAIRHDRDVLSFAAASRPRGD